MISASKINFNKIISIGLSKSLSLDETMHLASLAGLFKDIKLDIRSTIVLLLQEKGLVNYNAEEKKVTITTKGRNIFKSELTNNSDLAKELRELFPAGLKDNKWPWRSTNLQIKEKLDEFKKMYPEATDDQIISATKNYLQRMNDNDNGRSLLCYFILKRTDDGRKSILAEYIDMEEDLKKGKGINPTGNIMQI